MSLVSITFIRSSEEMHNQHVNNAASEATMTTFDKLSNAWHTPAVPEDLAIRWGTHHRQCK